MRLFVRWLIIAISLFFAVLIVPGVRVEGNAWVVVTVMAIVLGLVNALVKPILKFLSCGFIVLTMGLFLLVINAFTLWLASWISQQWLNIGFIVDGFISALFGSIIISIVSFVLNMIFSDKD
jgi:putative membrane protein